MSDEDWQTHAFVLDRIVPFRDILRIAYAMGVIPSFTLESQLFVKQLLERHDRAKWLSHGMWKVSCENATQPRYATAPAPVDKRRAQLDPDAIHERDRAIYAEYVAGNHRGDASQQALALKYGLSRSRLNQIVRKGDVRARLEAHDKALAPGPA